MSSVFKTTTEQYTDSRRQQTDLHLQLQSHWIRPKQSSLSICYIHSCLERCIVPHQDIVNPRTHTLTHYNTLAAAQSICSQVVWLVFVFWRQYKLRGWSSCQFLRRQGRHLQSVTEETERSRFNWKEHMKTNHGRCRDVQKSLLHENMSHKQLIRIILRFKCQ